MTKIAREQLATGQTLKLFYKATMRHQPYALLALLLPIGGIFMSVASPFFAGRLLAGVAQHSEHLGRELWLLGLSSVIGLICNRVGFNSCMTAQARAMNDLHQSVFNRLLSRSVGFHANHISGKLVSDAIDFMGSYGNLLGAAFLNGMPFVFSVVAGMIVVFVSSWQLGVFVSFLVIATAIWAYIDSRMRAGMRLERLMASKALTGHLSDTIVNAPTVKTFSQEKLEAARNKQLNKTLQRIRIHDWHRSGRSGNNRMAALLVMQFGMLLFIVHLSRSNPETLGAGIFAFTYTFMLSSRLMEINGLTRIIDEAFLNAAPMTRLLQEEAEIQDAPGARSLEVTDGSITINNVQFAYAENAHTGGVFRNLNLSVRPGEKIGLVGPSGGGKSTLTRLLLRFDDVQSGAIDVDGQNIAEVTQESLRQSIAYVPQEPLLFHRSIRENIGYGRPEATDAEIIEAARKARAHDFIDALPGGYDTIVGERGVKLSGGQRQRVAIARAILKNAPILILDEATSALDSESEVLIQDALWELMKGRTTIVIAHRLSTIQKMDRIIVLDGGRIVEEGSHKELLQHEGTYAKLWAHQSGGFIEE